MAAIGTTEYGVMYMVKDSEEEYFHSGRNPWDRGRALADAISLQTRPTVTHIQLVERKWVKSK